MQNYFCNNIECERDIFKNYISSQAIPKLKFIVKIYILVAKFGTNIKLAIIDLKKLTFSINIEHFLKPNRIYNSQQSMRLY